MEQILSRCGYRCDLCLAWRPNAEADPANGRLLSDGWHRYFGFRIPAEEIVCDGCMAENPSLIDADCPVRPCVIGKGIANCSECAEYVCGRLSERLVDYGELAAGLAFPVPPEDRTRFILPYENRERLERLRSGRPGAATDDGCAD